MVILVAEDEGLIAFALEWALRLGGHQVLGPVDRVEAGVRLSEQTRPDLALVDLDLKHGDDGAQLARYLHERHRTPILFTSGQVDHARNHRHLAVGLIPKPYDTDRVLDVVSFIGDIARGRKPASAPRHVELFQQMPPLSPA